MYHIYIFIAVYELLRRGARDHRHRRLGHYAKSFLSRMIFQVSPYTNVNRDFRNIYLRLKAVFRFFFD